MIEKLLQQCLTDRFPERLWSRDVSLFSTRDEAGVRSIANRLGWLDAPAEFMPRIPELRLFAEEIVRQDFTDVVLLGMGGSSLGVEVVRDVLGVAPGYPAMHVLDSTHPDQVGAVRSAIDVRHSLFIVASKSGSTIEVDSFFRYFWAEVAQSGASNPGDHFIAITDPETQLASLASERRFRRIFTNRPDIGGRFSVLSYFGLVPAALMGVDLHQLLDRANVEARQSRSDDDRNPALLLGLQLADAARRGKNKLTLVFSPGLRSLGYWIEQLVAESTGKDGVGLLPIEGETLAAGSVGDDRILVRMLLAGDEPPAAFDVADRIQITLADPYDLGAQFFRWEYATAVAGALLDINPFDEPNVTESKTNSMKVLSSYEEQGSLSHGRAREPYTFEAVERFVAQHASAGRYIALMAFAPHDHKFEQLLNDIRIRLGARFALPVTLGYGPRFLHSTGQYHKGGIPNGIFVQFFAPPSVNIPIPGKPYSFGVLVEAQAIGDAESLRSRDFPVAEFDLG